MNKKNVNEVFDFMDIDKDGKIGRSELEKIFKGQDQQEVQHMIDNILAECDKDNDGYITKPEFEKAMGLATDSRTVSPVKPQAKHNFFTKKPVAV